MEFRAFIIAFLMTLSVFAVQSGFAGYGNVTVVHSSGNGTLSRADTALMTQKLLLTESVRVFYLDDARFFSFTNRADGERFSSLLFMQGMTRVSQPGVAKRVYKTGKFYRVYLSKSQYRVYRKNLMKMVAVDQPIVVVNKPQSKVVVVERPAPVQKVVVVKPQPIKTIVVKPARPAKKIVVVNKSKPRKRVVVHKRHPAKVVHVYHTNYNQPRLKLQGKIPVNKHGANFKVGISLPL